MKIILLRCIDSAHKGFEFQSRFIKILLIILLDTGKIDVYQTSSGFGVRLDGGNGFAGATITPYYDSLLVKAITYARTFEDTIDKMIRVLKETKIKGVKTNISFILNVLNNKEFREGKCDTSFIAEHPELLTFSLQKGNKEQKLLNFLGNKVVNEYTPKPKFNVPIVPKIEVPENLEGTKQILDKHGPEYLSKWVYDQKALLFTETSMRDAQQSLIATRVRTVDMEKLHLQYLYWQKTYSLWKCGAALLLTLLTDS